MGTPPRFWSISLDVVEPARSVLLQCSKFVPRGSFVHPFFLGFVAKKIDMASAMEKERGSNDVSDEKLEAQKRDYLDDAQAHTNDPIPDPDAGLSAEERAAIVCSAAPVLRNWHNLTCDQDRKLLWKLDRYLIPWLSFLYLISFLDRTNIGECDPSWLYRVSFSSSTILLHRKQRTARSYCHMCTRTLIILQVTQK